MAKEYNIAKTSGTCCGCETELTPGTQLIAILAETNDALERLDFCQRCFDDGKHEEDSAREIIGSWKSVVPEPKQKKKLFVDNELLGNLFERLGQSDAESKINFRFVVALVLMRKKILIYDGMGTADGKEVWKMHFRGSDENHDVIDPHMDDEKIAEVTDQLGEILEGEL